MPKKNATIDESSIYLLGASGGGHAALLMAGRHPKIWAGVSAWVPISNLKAWHGESSRYAKDIVKSCGGAPGTSAKVDEEYRKRSPLTSLGNAKGVTLHIHGGIYDKIVPVSHSLYAFNQVASIKDRLTKEEIHLISKKHQIPEKLKTSVPDPGYGKMPPVLQRTSGNATLTVFKGGHEIIEQAAIAWIEGIHQKKGGTTKSVNRSTASKEIKRIMFFGDSITSSGKWVKRVDADDSIVALNEGKSGLRVVWAKKELSRRMARHKELDQLVIMLGVNDLPARDKRPGDVKVAGCIKNMSETIDLALTRFKPMDVILVAPCTVNPENMSRGNIHKGYHVTGPLLAALEKGYRQLAKEKGIRFESILNVVSKENFRDGLHPNQAGDEQIAEAVLKFVTAQ